MKNFPRQKNRAFTPTPFLKKGVSSQSERGFTLVETLVAISIFTLSILSLLSVLSQGVSNTNYAKQKIIASYLAQEGIEYIRNMRDTHVLFTDIGNPWNNFKSELAPCNAGNGCSFDVVLPYDFSVCNGGDACKLYIDNGNYNTLTGTDSGFTRKVWLTNVGNGNDQVKIYSRVSWSQGSGNYNITFAEDLFNWIE